LQEFSHRQNGAVKYHKTHAGEKFYNN